LHSRLRPAVGDAAAPRTLGWQAYLDRVLPAFTELQRQGLIVEWGITGVGHPDAVLDTLSGEVPPAAVQVVINALDMSGDMWIFGDRDAPSNQSILDAAVMAGVPVVGIRAVAAGALTDSFDRVIDPGHPAHGDYQRAQGVRRLAAEFGESAASLAHRYALSVAGVATVVLGVKNRAELHECLRAEERGPLTGAEMDAVRRL